MDLTRRALLGTALAAGLHVPGNVLAQGAKPRRILLGQSVPLTGAASEIGLAFAAGAKLYFDAFNERKPNPGWTFELRQLDDGYTATSAAANARKLLADGADLLFGFVGTASSDAAAQVARQQGALFFAPFAASDALHDTAAFPTVFNIRPSLTDEAIRMVRHCATLNQTRIALLAEDDAMGRAGKLALERAVAELKLPPPVAIAFVPANSNQVGSAVATLEKAQPHAIIQAALFNTTAASIRALRKSGYAGAFMNFSVVGIDPLFTALGKEIGGVVVSQVVPSPRSVTVPIVREYLAAIDKSDQSPSYESLEGFIAAKALAEAVRRTGRGADRTALQRTMAGMTDYDVGGFHLNLRVGVRDASRPIDLVSITSDGRIIR
ncbi:MAG TPA: ABC transporter substrate-binding protein [Burkholderiaceae bacterium]